MGAAGLRAAQRKDRYSLAKPATFQHAALQRAAWLPKAQTQPMHGRSFFLWRKSKANGSQKPGECRKSRPHRSGAFRWHEAKSNPPPRLEFSPPEEAPPAPELQDREPQDDAPHWSILRQATWPKAPHPAARRGRRTLKSHRRRLPQGAFPSDRHSRACHRNFASHCHPGPWQTSTKAKPRNPTPRLPRHPPFQRRPLKPPDKKSGLP